MTPTKIETEMNIAERFHVTVEQMDKATRLVDGDDKTFYQVESQSERGRLYEVRYHADRRLLSCTCKAGQEGYGCWHRRAALAVDYQERQYRNAQALASAGDEQAKKRLEMVALENDINRKIARRYSNWSFSYYARKELEKRLEEGRE